jgi:hypothetical protein
MIVPPTAWLSASFCHWSFDKGLLGISQRYTVMSSAQLFAHDNFSGHLSSLKGRAIGKPSRDALAGSRFPPVASQEASALCDLAHTFAVPQVA